MIDQSHKYTDVKGSELTGPGGAGVEYFIALKPEYRKDGDPEFIEKLVFQNGAIAEVGVNGVMNENLLAIVIDRLQGFQNGPYACSQNQDALEACMVALDALKERTQIREGAGVEGTMEKGPESDR